MFEDSLMESQNRLSSPNQRWTTALSLTLQCSVVAVMVALPLLHPEALPFRVDAPKITLPLTSVPPPVPHIEAADAASPALVTPSGARPSLDLNHLQRLAENISDSPPMTSFIGIGMGDVNGFWNAVGNSIVSTVPQTRVALAKPAPQRIPHISTGISTGLLLAPIVPVYPRIAVNAHVEGIVRIEAVISKSGRIESAHVVCGPEILRQAALDAVRNARYTAYMLNGSPTEVETAVTVNFRLF